MYLYSATQQKGKNKKSEVKGKQKNTAKREESVTLFAALYCISQPLLFSTRATINANVQRGECRENNYPLPQPAGLFINMQLWFHGSPLYTSHSRAKKKIFCQGIINENILNTAERLTAQPLNLSEIMQYFHTADWVWVAWWWAWTIWGFGPEAGDEKGTDITTLWWVIADFN